MESPQNCVSHTHTSLFRTAGQKHATKLLGPPTVRIACSSRALRLLSSESLMVALGKRRVQSCAINYCTTCLTLAAAFLTLRAEVSIANDGP